MQYSTHTSASCWIIYKSSILTAHYRRYRFEKLTYTYCVKFHIEKIWTKKHQTVRSWKVSKMVWLSSGEALSIKSLRLFYCNFDIFCIGILTFTTHKKQHQFAGTKVASKKTKSVFQIQFVIVLGPLTK